MPTENAVRTALREWVLCEEASQVDLVDEFWVPGSNERADLALVADTLDGFEIKTAQDTLKRLPRQSSAFARLFDHCTAVIAGHHLDATTQLLPDWWGLVVIHDRDGAVEFESLRDAQPNPSVDVETLVRLLWKEEARNALSTVGVEVDEGVSRCVLWERLVEAVSLARLGELVRQALLGRDPSRARIPSRRFAINQPVAGQ